MLSDAWLRARMRSTVRTPMRGTPRPGARSKAISLLESSPFDELRWHGHQLHLRYLRAPQRNDLGRPRSCLPDEADVQRAGTGVPDRLPDDGERLDTTEGDVRYDSAGGILTSRRSEAHPLLKATHWWADSRRSRERRHQHGDDETIDANRGRPTNIKTAAVASPFRT